jgi:hypothetical protein
MNFSHKLIAYKVQVCWLYTLMTKLEQLHKVYEILLGA